ncbi:hypothetical protein [Caldinitratiruptor microaerophilus]|uniref:Heavy-metal-associated domain-containing protein n=1 Tax=Caldinitratiruptor microaerophilus TaxID=671077 RepID=A0AA35CNJ7_9FIRM|nr:hypothetical protein [Caldinitratiruptor microaerophilus]BDG61688.1 hypothetical protein caldi_27780 [Caldinitratiruptor microaerophilus]
MTGEPCKVRLRVPGAGLPGARDRVRAVLQGLPGVLRVRVDPPPPAAVPGTPALVTVTFLPGARRSAEFVAALAEAGFPGAQVL